MTPVRRGLTAGCLSLGLLAAACGVSLKPDPDAFGHAQAVYNKLASGDVEALMAELPEEARNATTERTLGVLHEILPPGQGEPAKLVGWNNAVFNGVRSATLVERYDYGDEHIIATVTLVRKDDAWTLRDINVRGAGANEIGTPVFMTGLEPPPVRTEPGDS